jgi:flagellum-specific ATP synthase
VTSVPPGTTDPAANLAARLRARLAHWHERLGPHIVPPVEGRVTRMTGLTLEAEGCEAMIGSRCTVRGSHAEPIEAEVVGFSGDRLYLMPTTGIRGLTPGARVIPSDRVSAADVGDGLLGRVLDGAGHPLDGAGPVGGGRRMPLNGRSINPMQRRPIRESLDVGVRAINALLTVGRGQRLGLFAGSGVGKSVLLGMMTRFTAADVVVVGLIGERGREVKEFVEHVLGAQGMRRAVVVVAPSDSPPLMRLHGAMLATAIAEYFRDCGRQVLLLMDSLTRFAQAEREIGLAIGEPPATKGYPPSVFARIPQLVERAGNNETPGGSITAFYTVLVEGDDLDDPIADSVRATLDGHIVLSRHLADAGHYPAIDIHRSISRVFTDIADAGQQQAVRRFRHLYANYEQQRDLINIGAYQAGTDPRIDEAIEFHPRLMDFLRQDADTPVSLSESVRTLLALLPGNGMQPP